MIELSLLKYHNCVSILIKIPRLCVYVDIYFQMRSGCAFMVHVCEDEYQLYYNFFTKHSGLLE